MSDTTYSFEGPDFVIENGILKGAKVPYKDDNNNYGQKIFDCLKAEPDFVGQVDGETGREETFGEMMEKSVKCAIWMKKQNIKPGDVIATCVGVCMDQYVPCFATLYIGAIFNPWWDISNNKELTRHFLYLTKPKILFADDAAAPTALEVAQEIGMNLKIVVLGKTPGLQSLDEILAGEDVKLVADFNCTKLSSLRDPAFIVCTSGTTGRPKGALHTHESLFGNLNLALAFGDANTSLVFSPIAWISGLLLMLRGVVAKDRRIVYPEFTEKKTLEFIEKYKVHWMMLGTSGAFRLQKCPEIEKYDISSLKFIAIGGAVLKESTQKALVETFPTVAIFQAYGMTEMGGVTIQQKPNFKHGSVGHIVKNIEMKVIDPETHKVLGPNQTGEACFKSPFMLSSYYRDPDATNKAVDSEGWYHSGDLVHYDEEGNVFITDRIKEMIKYRGHHISPAMVEEVLQTNPGISEVAVLGIPHDLDDEHAVAFVAKTPTSNVTQQELEKLVAESLPDYMRLRGGVIFLDQLPHTSSGKVARAELKKLANSSIRFL